MPGPANTGNGCNVDESVQVYNECNFLKFVWLSGNESGRVDYFAKKNITIQQTNTGNFWIRDNAHTLYLKYTEIDSTQPTDHTTQDQFINKLLNWICLEDQNDPASASTDSFGRQRTAHCNNVFHSQYRYDLQPLLFNTLITNTDGVADPTDGVDTSYTKTGDVGTVAQSVTPTPAVYLNTYFPGEDGAGTTFPYPSDQVAIYQTKTYMPFQADSTMYVVIGATMRTVLAVDYNTARLGYYDDANNKDVSADIGGSGVFFEMDPAGAVSAGIRNFVSGAQADTLVAQADWNLDQMDGTGASTDNIDFTKPQLYCFEIEMSSSRIRLGFNVNGGIVWAHQFVNYNTTDENQLFNYSLPIRAELINSSPGGDTIVQGSGEMRVYSTSADVCGNSNGSDGALQSNPFNYCVNSQIDCATILHSSGEHRPLIAIRLDPTKSRGIVWPKQIDVDNETGVMVLWRLILNPGGLTPTWNAVSVNSFAQYSTVDNSVTITEDTESNSSVVLACGYMSTTFTKDVSDIFKNFGLHSSIDGIVPDVLALTVEHVRGAARVRGTMSWVETK
jgi:hypothetical protein